eukprot:8828445-Alexandrium_andersonii.AAC.1
MAKPCLVQRFDVASAGNASMQAFPAGFPAAVDMLLECSWKDLSGSLAQWSSLGPSAGQGGFLE